MAARKGRMLVVIDTNVLVGYYLSRSQSSTNAQVIRLWRDRRQLQLLVSREVVEEYLEVVERLGVARTRIQRLAERFEQRRSVTHIKLGRQYLLKRIGS